MQPFENFTKFLSNLKIDIRKSEIICGFLPIVFLSYVLLPEQILFYKYMIYGYFAFLIGYIIVRTRTCVMDLLPIGKKSVDIPIVELEDLAKKLRLDLPTNPFCTVDKRNVLARAKGNKILFGEDFLNILSSDEKIFVGGHEFFHIHGHAEHYILVAMIPVFLLASILLILLNVNYLVVGIICMGLLLVSISLAKRSIESMADLYGAKYAGNDAAISALTKGYATKKHTLFDFHPRLQIRIRNIEEHYSKV